MPDRDGMVLPHGSLNAFDASAFELPARGDQGSVGGVYIGTLQVNVDGSMLGARTPRELAEAIGDELQGVLIRKLRRNGDLGL